MLNMYIVFLIRYPDQFLHTFKFLAKDKWCIYHVKIFPGPTHDIGFPSKKAGLKCTLILYTTNAKEMLFSSLLYLRYIMIC